MSDANAFKIELSEQEMFAALGDVAYQSIEAYQCMINFETHGETNLAEIAARTMHTADERFQSLWNNLFGEE